MLIVPRTDSVLDYLFIDRELSKDINSRINARGAGVPLFSSVLLNHSLTRWAPTDPEREFSALLLLLIIFCGIIIVMWP